MYKFKFRLKRLHVRWRKWKKKVDNKMTYKHDSSAFESKSVKFWKIFLKDPDTHMSFNTSGVRQIERDSVLMILEPNNESSTEYIMTIMDICDERRSVYELHVTSKVAENVCECFDIEMEKRMKSAEKSKRDLIEKDIDNLLEKETKNFQEKILKKHLVD